MSIPEGFKAVIGQLLTEDAVFERLMYKNKNQHRRGLYFRKLQQVRRGLKLLRVADLNKMLLKLSQFLSQSTPKKIKTDNSIENGEAILRQLLGVARLLTQMNQPVLRASVQLAGLLEQCFFMPFALTMISILARFRVLFQQILVDVVSLYNTIWPIVQRKRSSSVLHATKPKNSSLPSSLDCIWAGDQFNLREENSSDDAIVETWFIDDRTKRPQNNHQQKADTTALETTIHAPQQSTPVAIATASSFLGFVDRSLSSGSKRKVAYISIEDKSNITTTPAATTTPISTTENEKKKSRTDELFQLLTGTMASNNLF